MPFDLSPLAAAWVAFAVFGASIVRGYSGFGFAAIILAAAGLVTNPLFLVPVIPLADIFLSAGQARSIWHEIDWRRVAAMGAGAVVGVPLGVALIVPLEPNTIRAIISATILAFCGLLWLGLSFKRPLGLPAHGIAGAISGVCNGVALGGLFPGIFFSAQPIAPATFRATIVGFFFAMNLWTIPVMARGGMIQADTLIATALLLPIMGTGVWLGSRQFRASSPEGFRSFAIGLLAALSVANLGKAVL